MAANNPPPPVFTPDQVNAAREAIVAGANADPGAVVQAVATEALRRTIEEQRPQGSITPPKFSSCEPSDWLNFRQSYEDCVHVNRWNNDKARRSLRPCMEGKALDAINGIDTAVEQPLAALLDQVEALFVTAVGGQHARADFNAARQKEGETCLQFHSRLRSLHQRAFPDIADRNGDVNLINHFVTSFRHDYVTMKVSEANPQTLQAALQAANAAEATIALLQRKHKGKMPQLGQLGDVNALDGGSGSGPGEGKSRFKGSCYYCGKTGHTKRECRKRQRDLKSGNGGGNNGGNNGSSGGGNGGRGGRGQSGRVNEVHETGRSQDKSPQPHDSDVSGQE